MDATAPTTAQKTREEDKRTRGEITTKRNDANNSKLSAEAQAELHFSIKTRKCFEDS